MILSLFGNANAKVLKKLQPQVKAINAHAEATDALDAAAIQDAFNALKKRHAAGETLDKLLPESFALTRRAAELSLGLRPYDVQLVGGIVLHQGKIAEMKTGEGKTLMSTLAASLNALSGKGVHVVTVNDYLAARDADWMRPVFETLGLSVAAVVSGMTHEERRAAYAADITYATNNELGFDYLRDNMAMDVRECVQRAPHFAVVDEVDSILIDEARTPLIISGQAEDKSDLYLLADKVAPQLENETDFDLDEKRRSAQLTDAGTDKVESIFREKGLLKEGTHLFDAENILLVHHVQNALRAYHLFQRDVQYVVNQGNIVLIDEFTNRMTPGRRLSDGLHQAIEAKEGLQLQAENQTLCSITYQNYFRLYPKLAGMTGTAGTEAEEFASIYNLEVVEIPTHRPVARKDAADMIYRTRAAKLKAIVKDVEETQAKGQPILVGTTSIEKSEELSDLLNAANVKHNVLNAKQHEREAEIVAQAGRKGAVTVATNMAGRGTDIKLGGNLELLLEDAKTQKEKDEIAESHAAEQQTVKDLGGLKILGTERHESRRIDNQLRGRSGRQGDPGESVFYLSLQDDLMRLFAKNLDTMMARMNMPEDEAIQHRMVSGAIATAQKKIEGMHFESRKNILKFDNVLNDQRKVIFTERHKVLTAEDVLPMVADWQEQVLDYIMDTHCPEHKKPEQWDVNALTQDLQRQFNTAIDAGYMLKQSGGDLEVLEDTLLSQIHDNTEARLNKLPDDIRQQAARMLLLQTLDRHWRYYLQQVDALRQGIGWRGLAQKDPINEFTKEAFALFETMRLNLKRDSVTIIARLDVQVEKG